MKEVLHEIRSVYYIKALLEVCMIVVLLKLFFGNKKLLFRMYFVVYIIAFLLISVIFYLSVFTIINDRYSFLHEIFNFLFAAVEFLVFYKFFSVISPSIKRNRIIKFSLFSVIPIIMILFLRIFTDELSGREVIKIGETICVTELSILILFCLYYFFDIYRENKPLHYAYSIIVIALFGYCIISIPFFSIAENLYKTDKKLYDIFYTLHFMSLLILCLAIGYYAFTAKEEEMPKKKQSLCLKNSPHEQTIINSPIVDYRIPFS